MNNARPLIAGSIGTLWIVVGGCGAAVIVCDHANANRALVPIEEACFNRPCNEPKASDGTPQEHGAYRACSEPIAAEMALAVDRR